MLTPVSDIAVLMDIDERRFREILSANLILQVWLTARVKPNAPFRSDRTNLNWLKPEVRLPFSLLVHIFVIWTQTKTYNDLCHYQQL